MDRSKIVEVDRTSSGRYALLRYGDTFVAVKILGTRPGPEEDAKRQFHSQFDWRDRVGGTAGRYTG